MVATTDSFTSIHVYINPIARTIDHISFNVVDGESGSIGYIAGEPPASGQGYDELQILRTIYASAEGFTDGDGNALVPVVENLGDLGITTVEQLGDHEDYVNPFADPDAVQTGGTVSLGYGHFSIILWQDVVDANVATTADPNINPLDGDNLRTGWGSWATEEPSADLAAGSTRLQAVGYYSTDADGNYSTIEWVVSAVEQIQYSRDQITWTDHRDTSDTTFRSLWQRVRQEDGTWTVTRIADGQDGWIDRFGDIPAYSGGDYTTRQATISPDFDLTHFHEMEVSVRAFGRAESNGTYTRFGARGTKIMSRPADGWTVRTASGGNVLTRGGYKVRLDDVTGLDVVQALSDWINESLDSNVYASSDDPERRMSFNFLLRKLSASGDDNIISSIIVFDFPNTWAKCILNVRFR